MSSKCALSTCEVGIAAAKFLPPSVLPDKSVILAQKQTNGRGRFDRTWIDLGEGNVFISIVLKPSDVFLPVYSNLTQYLSVILCRIFDEYGIDTTIKWPNDVYVNRRQKICGILCESTYNNGVFNVTSGIGINVSNRKPTTCLEEQVKEKTGKIVHISRGKLLGNFIRIWIMYIPLFVNQGFAPFLDTYYKWWLHSNQHVNVVNDNGSYSSVVIKGIDSNGFLQAVDQDGTVLQLFPDGNSFNFLDGLISKKV